MSDEKDRDAEREAIHGLSNPTVRKKLLGSFDDSEAIIKALGVSETLVDNLKLISTSEFLGGYVNNSRSLFEEQNGVSLSQAYSLYKEYCDREEPEFRLPQLKFREELTKYFEEFHDRIRVNGVYVRSYYSGFKFPRTGNSKEITTPSDEFVDKYYEMDPETEELLFDGSYLHEGMNVLVSHASQRHDIRANMSDHWLENAKVENRWGVVSHVQVTDDQVAFIATYSDGTKRKRSYPITFGWLVKLDSISMPEPLKTSDEIL